MRNQIPTRNNTSGIPERKFANAVWESKLPAKSRELIATIA
jgi:hypothetical protein